MTTTRSDLRFALRYLRRRPGFAAVAILTLAAAVGATTAVFSLVWGVVLQPLDVPDPGRLYWVAEDRVVRGGERGDVTGQTVFATWRDASRSFEAMGASLNSEGERLSLVVDGKAEPVVGALVSAGYFRTLGVAPALGRELREEEGVVGQDGAVVLSHALWQERWGGRPDVLGARVTVAGRVREVVGVMPAGFRDPLSPGAALWVPLALPPGEDDVGGQYVRAIGRLAQGASPQRAEAELDATMKGFGERFPEAYQGVGVSVQPLREVLVGTVRAPAAALFGAVLLVLAIACVNLANLLLARASERERELAVRTAVGAGRLRLVRQLLTESLVLAGIGGVLALPLGYALLRILVAAAPAGVPRLDEVGLHPPVFLFALVATLGVGVLFGVLPAWTAARRPAGTSLRQGNRTVGGGSVVRRSLVVGEVALSLALLVGAGLLVRSLLALGDVSPGFRTEGLLAAEIQLDRDRYPEGADVRAGLDAILDALRRDPRVQSVAATSVLPLTDTFTDTTFRIEGQPPPREGEDLVLYQMVTPGYFETMGIPMRAGRELAAGDDANAPAVLVVNEAFVRRHLADGVDPIGREVVLGGSDETPVFRIVGVAGSIRFGALGQDPEPLVYLPHARFSSRGLQVLVRTEREPRSLVGFVRESLRAVDPGLALMQVSTGPELVGRQLAMPRFLALLVGSFAAVAVGLASVGLYGVMTFLVARRRREIGVRLTLGARPGEVLRMVVRQGVVLAGAGVVAGTVLAVGLTRGLGSLLYGVRPGDPWSLAAGGTLLLVVAVLACLVPGLRAARIDPVDVLKGE